MGLRIWHYLTGVKVVAECLGSSQKIATQECAQHLLHQLAMVCDHTHLINITNYRVTLVTKPKCTNHLLHYYIRHLVRLKDSLHILYVRYK